LYWRSFYNGTASGGRSCEAGRSEDGNSNALRTFPVLTGTPEVFERELKKRKVKTRLRVMHPGETIALDSKVRN